MRACDNHGLGNRGEPPGLPATPKTASPTAPRGGAGPASKPYDLPRKRIADYLDAAVAHPQPEVAVLGQVTADLALLTLELFRSIEENIRDCEDVRDYVDAAVEGQETVIKLSRQIERNIRLSRELTRGQEKAEHAARQEIAPWQPSGPDLGEGTSAEGMPVDGTPANGTPTKRAPADGTSEEIGI
jgi:hypothetical protein